MFNKNPKKMNLKNLREKKGSLIKQMEDIKKQADEENRLMTDEESKRFDAFDTEMETVNREIRHTERLEQNVEHVEPETKTIEEKRMADFVRYIKTGVVGETMEYRATQSGLNTTTTTGGYLIPQDFGDELIKSLQIWSEVRKWARVYPTDSGNDLPFPTVNDVSNTGRLLAEETQATQTLLTFGQKILKAYVFSSDMVPVSFQLLQDSAFDPQTMLNELLAERCFRCEDGYFTTGTGSSQPGGFVAQSIKGADFAATALTRLVILDLLHSVNKAYRNSPRAAWAMNDSTLKAIKKLAIGSGDDRPIWQPSMIAGEPDKLEGFPYFIAPSMANIGASAKSMVFGDFGKFVIRDVKGLTLIRLNERYADYLQIGFMMFSRADSALLDTAAIKHGLHAAS
jgi:HK97 family phage major capsid protein